MALNTRTNYFVSEIDQVLRAAPASDAAAVNHLLLGDWLRYLGEETTEWAKIRSRNTTGWLPKSAFGEQRLLEVNFLDIGQGDGCHIVTPEDQIILIDSGVDDNMFRFLNWRYNLRRLKVVGVDGVVAGEAGTRAPIDLDHVVISHPDKDHYFGFRQIFEHGKLRPRNIYHNSLVERTIDLSDKDPGLKYYSGDDLGGYLQSGGAVYVWDVITTNQQMHDLIAKHASTRKSYLSTLRAAQENNPAVQFTALSSDDGYIDGFAESAALRFKVLGPLTEQVSHGGESKQCLRRLGNKSITKNGHSVVLQLQIGKLKVMLGGDLNTQSEDYLLRHYGGATRSVAKLEQQIYQLMEKGSSISSEERQKLEVMQTEIDAVVAKARVHLQVDVTKACHHGSHHFSNTFLKSLNAVATVISSGDNESYSHPRPDALGAFGKYSRGNRPLIFSTELARSTREFIHVYDYINILHDYEKRIAEATTQTEKNRLEREMQERKDRNVAVYGMITLRTDGEKTIIAQKIEAPIKPSVKWDIHELRFNSDTQEFCYRPFGR